MVLASNVEEVLFVGDVHGNLQGLEAAVNLAKKRGINRKYCLGDLPNPQFLAELSKSQMTRTESFRNSLRPTIDGQGSLADSTTRETIKDGHYSDEQLKALADPRQACLEIIANHSNWVYDRIPEDLTVVPGNHDREEIHDKLGDRLRFQEFRTEDDMRILYGGKGGSAPIGATGTAEGFCSDHQDEGIQHAPGLKKLIAKPRAQTQEENEIDMFIDHIGLPQGGKHVDLYARQIQDYFLERKRMGLPLPKLAVNGHHHMSEAEVGWKTYTDQITGESLEMLTLLPGVMAFEHNMGSEGVFCIGQFNDQKRLIRVEEYRVQRSLEGIMKVILYGEHLVDHEKKEVEFNPIRREVLSEDLKEVFPGKTALDDNYALVERGFVLDYKGLSGKELDLTLRQNLAVMDGYVTQATDIVKQALDTVKNKWFSEVPDLDASFSSQELVQRQREVADLLGDEAQKVLGISLDLEGKSEFDQLFYRRALMTAAFQISFDDIQKATDNEEMRYDKLPFSWGAELLGTVRKNVARKAQNEMLINITDEMFTAMVDEVYLPLNMERTKDINRDEAIGIYAKGLNKGVLTSEDLLETGCYQKKADFTPNKKTDAEIDAMFDVGYEEMPEITTERTEMDPSEAEGLQNAISERGLPIFQDSRGDYVIAIENDKPSKKYLGSELQDALEYTPTSLKEALDTDQANLVASGDQYLLHQGGLVSPIDFEAEGINPDDYEAVPLWQMIQQGQAQQQTQQNGGMNDYINELIRQQLERRDHNLGPDTNGNGAMPLREVAAPSLY